MQRHPLVDGHAIAIVAFLCAVGLAPSIADASGRQLHGGASLGYTPSLGLSGGHSGALGLNGAYDFTDAFRLWSSLEYSLGGGDPNATLRHSGSLTVGVAYVLDLLRAIPWFGLGFRAAVVGTPSWVGFVPAVEARVGVDIPTSRYFAVTTQFAYALPVANRDQVSHIFLLAVGVRFTADL
jgi:hypothetical protein